MVASALQLAARAFVRVLLALASQYSVSLSVNRDSSPVVLLSAYRRLLKKAHPDKGGRKEDVQTLQSLKEEWDRARNGPKAMQQFGQEPHSKHRGSDRKGGTNKAVWKNRWWLWGGRVG